MKRYSIIKKEFYNKGGYDTAFPISEENIIGLYKRKSAVQTKIRELFNPETMKIWDRWKDNPQIVRGLICQFGEEKYTNNGRNTRTCYDVYAVTEE